MSVTEIVEAFTGWGMSVSNEQILRPTPEFVLDIYLSCLKQVTKIDQDTLLEPTQAASATLDSSVRVYSPIPSSNSESGSSGNVYSFPVAQFLSISHVSMVVFATRPGV